MKNQFNFIGNDDSGPEDYLDDWDLECVRVFRSYLITIYV